MNASTGPLPPSGVPTLTEVVAWPAPGEAAPPPREPVPEALPLEAGGLPPPLPAPLLPAAAVWNAVAPAVPAEVPPPVVLPTEDELAQRVLAELQKQIELMLDYRMREVLTPILTRATDSVIRDARGELASTLRDVVQRAVAQELARHRDK